MRLLVPRLFSGEVRRITFQPYCLFCFSFKLAVLGCPTRQFPTQPARLYQGVFCKKMLNYIHCVVADVVLQRLLLPSLSIAYSFIEQLVSFLPNFMLVEDDFADGLDSAMSCKGLLELS